MQDYEKLGVFYLGRECDTDGKSVGDAPLLYDSKDLTTHAVCVGMTGSGKTGLCLALLEEAAIDGIPALCIDPKGDLANLALTFPNLAPADFLPWVDAGDAQRKGLSIEQLAAETAAQWKEGLAEWDQPPQRIARFKNATDLTIYTPGSESGVPLSVLRSFAAPPPESLTDTNALRERIAALVSGLLSLLGRNADPLKSREHILLANILERAWREGANLDMSALITAVQKPAFDKVGAFDLETFLPAKERLELAMAINTLIASPGFAAWLMGEPLDIQRLLFTPQGKPRLAILSIAHLSDPERMFIVTLVLNELLAWMRTQSGTGSVRALFYMDEIFGYFPPSATPPAKLPMLTLLKQARAFGLGCVLATQNPVDLDYKGLANAGTWFIGRLQTERDKQRVLDGLDSALAGAQNYDRANLEQQIANLKPRMFLMRNVHDDAPVLFKSRWALSWLRGPITGLEISRLMAEQKSAARRGMNAPPVTQATPAENLFQRPSVPADVHEYFLPASEGSGPITYKPMILGTAKLHFVEAKLTIDQWQTMGYLAPLADDGSAALWEESKQSPDFVRQLQRTPAEGASFAPLPGPTLRAASYVTWGKALAAYLYQSARAQALVCDALKVSSAPGASEGDFRAQLAVSARAQRDGAVADLKRKYAPKLTTLEDQARRATERVERERSQLSQQKLQTVFSVGASILGAVLGRRKLSATNINRAASAARSATRIGHESEDVDRANDSLEVIQQRQKDLQQQFSVDTAALEGRFDVSAIPLQKIQLSPRKADIAIGELALVWTPWRKGADGFPAPAFVA